MTRKRQDREDGLLLKEFIMNDLSDLFDNTMNSMAILRKGFGDALDVDGVALSCFV